MKKKSTSQWIIVIVLFFLLVGIMVFAIMNPNENNNTVSNIKSNNVSTDNKISEETVKEANEQYKGYSDYIVTPSKTYYKIEEIYEDNERVFIKIEASDIFSKPENDMSYGNALGNTMTLLMSDFFPEGTILVIECEENIVFTGNIL